MGVSLASTSGWTERLVTESLAHGESPVRV